MGGGKSLISLWDKRIAESNFRTLNTHVYCLNFQATPYDESSTKTSKVTKQMSLSGMLCGALDIENMFANHTEQLLVTFRSRDVFK